MRSLRLVAVVAALGVFIGCAGPAGADLRPGMLRTFAIERSHDGRPALCTLGGGFPSVRGILRGDPTDPELVWLVTPGGARISVVWPEGFGVRFAPDPALLDEHGAVVARAGELVELAQVIQGSAAGTLADPYVASGIVFGGCYPRRG